MPDVTYTPGEWFAVVTPRALACVPATTTAPVLARLREVLVDPAVEGVGEALGVLTSSGASFADLPDFAVAIQVGRTWSVAVRGQILVATGDQAVSGVGVSTWSERVLEDSGTLTLDLPGFDSSADDDGADLVIEAGIVRAARLVVGAAWPAVSLANAAAPEVEAPEIEVPDIEVPEIDARTHHTATEELVSDPVPAPQPVDPVAPAPAPAPAPAVAPAPAPPRAADAHLWDRTVHADAAAAPSSPAPAPSPLTIPQHVPVAGAVDDSDQIVVPNFARVNQPPVPAPAPAPAPAPQPPAPAPAQGDHDDQTIFSADLQAARGAAGALPPPPPAPQGPTALSLICPFGHLSPPHAVTCRECGTAVQGPAVQATRPTLGLLRLPSGEAITLDRSVVLGRKPQASRVTGADVPHLLALDAHEISRSHLEVRLEEWNVLGVDLDSRNGTTLIRPGEAPRRLPPQEAVPLRTGDVLDLGEGMMVRLEDLP